MGGALLPVAFALVIVLMIAVTAIGVLRMDENNARMQEIVENHNVKSNLIGTMYAAARERSISLLRMVNMDDVFDREAEYDRFNEMATDFAVARLTFQDMLSSEMERAHLERQRGLVRRAVPLQETVIDLLVGDDVAQAVDVLLNQAIPAQDDVLLLLGEMLSYQQEAARGELERARQVVHDTTLFMATLAVVAVLLSVGIAFYVVRRTNRAERALRLAADTLERRVEERTRELTTAYDDLKKSQAQLVLSEKMASLGQLTAGIAHEIKNPLNFINNFSETARESVSELRESLTSATERVDGEQAEHTEELLGDLDADLGRIAEHGRRADSIVRSMLMHARGDSGEREPTNLNALVEESLNLAYHSERARDSRFNVALVKELDEELPPLAVVPQEVSRVLVNLIANGFYATQRRQEQVSEESGYAPTLKVSTRNLGDAAEIVIEDNGVGMSAALVEKMFTPFFTTKPTGQGTGLGLSLSREIVSQQYRGTIDCASTEGEGSRFTVRLPYASVRADDHVSSAELSYAER